LLIQAIAVGVTLVYSFVVSLILYKIVDFIMKARVPEKEENLGLDLTQHHENAYTMIE
jgi:Amt family ammonium transporter